MTSVRGSSLQYCTRSLPETSALLPTETNVEMPRFRRRASSRSARPRAPLCEDRPTRPSGGWTGENVALRRTRGSVLMRPMQLGPTMRIPAARTFSRIAASRWRPSAPVSRNPALMMTSAAHAARDAVVDGGLDRGRRNGENREIHGSRNRPDARIRAPPRDARRLRIDRVDLSAETGREQVVQDLRADLAATPRRPDDGHGARLEESLHRGRGRARRPLRGALFERGSRLERDDDSDCTRLGAVRDLEPGVREDVEHAAVRGMDLGGELRQTAPACDLREPLEEARSESLAMQRVLDGQRDLRRVRMPWIHVVAGRGNEADSGLGDEHDLALAVRRDESRGECGGRRAGDAEDPKVEALGRKGLVQPSDLGEIRRLDGTQADRRARAQDHVGRLGRSKGRIFHWKRALKLRDRAAPALIRTNHMDDGAGRLGFTM